MKKRIAYKDIFSIILMLVLFSALATGFAYLNSTPLEEIKGWGKLLLISMQYYLIFIVGRTIFHLAFSFASYLFRPRPKESFEYPFVSVIVPCFNEERVLKIAVESLLGIDYPNFEVLIIDDGSTDETLKVANELEKKTKVRVIHQENVGKASALNRGILEANGEFILCMDADSALDPSVIKVGIEHFIADEKLAAVSGNLKIGNKGNLLLDFQKLEYISGLNFIKEAQSFLKSVMIVPGPIGLFRKSAVQEINGYGVETFAEDADLTIRLLMEGYHTIYEPKMIAYTEAPKDLFPLIAQRYRWTRGILQTIKQNSKWLFTPFSSFRNFFLLSYLTVETVVIPLANFCFIIAALNYALIHSNAHILGHFFYQLTVLDLVLATYCVIQEKSEYWLVPLALVNRVTFALALEVIRFFSILDEILCMPMKWDKLKREGLGAA